MSAGIERGLVLVDVLIGAPEDVAGGLQEYLDATGYRRVMLLMAIPGLGTAAALRSMRLFADEVAPALGPVAHGAGVREEREGLGAGGRRTRASLQDRDAGTIEVHPARGRLRTSRSGAFARTPSLPY
jgi:hypothetical protein